MSEVLDVAKSFKALSEALSSCFPLRLRCKNVYVVIAVYLLRFLAYFVKKQPQTQAVDAVDG